MIWNIKELILEDLRAFCFELEKIALKAEQINNLHKVARIIAYVFELSQKKDGTFFFPSSLHSREKEIRDRIDKDWDKLEPFRDEDLDRSEEDLLSEIVMTLRALRKSFRKGNFQKVVLNYTSLEKFFLKLELHKHAATCTKNKHLISQNLEKLKMEYNVNKKNVKKQLEPRYKD